VFSGYAERSVDARMAKEMADGTQHSSNHVNSTRALIELGLGLQSELTD
jgi:hypothetical protein